MDKKTSEYIDEFLTFLREAQMEHSIAMQQESDAEKETQDILHWLEFHVGPDIRADNLLNTGINLGMIRQRRRAAKKAIETTRPVVAWQADHTQEVKSLERLLGEVRKAEKNTGCRHYTDKTGIMSEILGSSKETESDEPEE